MFVLVMYGLFFGYVVIFFPFFNIFRLACSLCCEIELPVPHALLPCLGYTDLMVAMGGASRSMLDHHDVC